MPRKKQGLRGYHHKSRNGCLQCKHRRVKCTMQAPACANCIRRNELCEYAGVVDQSTTQLNAVAQRRHGVAEGYHYMLPDGFFDRAPGSTAFHSSTWKPDFPDNTISLDPLMVTALKRIMGRAWMTPVETGVWSKAIMKNIIKHSYLQHCIFSIFCLSQDVRRNGYRHGAGISVEAYEHQMAASALFRQDATAVNVDNWFVTLAFNVFMLSFQLGSQTACPDDHFNLVDTLRVMRSSNAIEEETRPYFRASELWTMAASRIPYVKMEVDQSLRTNLAALAKFIADTAMSDIKKAGANSQALKELSRWIDLCDAHPARWDQYCDWPGHLTPAFLDILLDDEVALLLVAHWAALLYRSPKPYVFSWARRVAFYAIGRLNQRERWESLLVWPLHVLQESKSEQMKMMDMGEHVKIQEVSKSLAAMKIEESEQDDLSSSIPHGGWHPRPMSSSPLHHPVTSSSTRSSISATNSPYDMSLAVPLGDFDRTRSTSPYDTSLAGPSGSFESSWPTRSSEILYTTRASSCESIPIDPSLLMMENAEQNDAERSQSPMSDPEMGIGLDLFA